jgi:hypothetical protein
MTTRISWGALASLLAVLAISSPVLGAVVINEVELDPSGDGNEWVELYNNGGEEVDISRWTVWIEDSDPTWTGVMKMPQDTVVPPGGFCVAEGDRSWIHKTGRGTVILKREDGAEADKTPLLRDQSDNFFTYFRHPNGVDTDQRSDWIFGKGTKNFPNSPNS